MDSTVLSIRHALADARAEVASQFQAMTEMANELRFGHFLIVYCRQAASLARWMCEWNDQVRDGLERAESLTLAPIFNEISQKLSFRHEIIEHDAVAISRWMVNHLHFDESLLLDKSTHSSGMKQLRFVSQDCVRRGYYVSWLFVMSEIERLRIIHGTTLIKLCELYYGKPILRCFSHIRYQHQSANALFNLCEKAILQHTALHTATIPSMISQIRTAIDAYARFVGDCYRISMKKAEHANTV